MTSTSRRDMLRATLGAFAGLLLGGRWPGARAEAQPPQFHPRFLAGISGARVHRFESPSNSLPMAIRSILEADPVLAEFAPGGTWFPDAPPDVRTPCVTFSASATVVESDVPTVGQLDLASYHPDSMMADRLAMQAAQSVALVALGDGLRFDGGVMRTYRGCWAGSHGRAVVRGGDVVHRGHAAFRFKLIPG